jgi:hypothetical protein
MAMRLSADMFNEIVASLKSDRSSTRAHEKRNEGRVGLRCSIDIITYIPYSFGAASTKAINVSVTNISVTGIGLVTGAKMEEGSEFVARFARDGAAPTSILYKVRYSRRLANDVFNTGAVLERILPEASAPASPGNPNSKKPAHTTAA